MSKIDFDKPINRLSGVFQDSTKWNRYRGRDILPLWVADMDFAVPDAVLDALRARIEHGVFGYSQPWPSLVEAVVEYQQREYGWHVEPEWLVWLPGLVTGLNVACRAVGAAGDGVFTATPIYPPFLSSPQLSSRRVLSLPLVQESTGWVWDFAAVDALFAREKPRLLLLCHPHNPVARAWHADELQQLLQLAEKHDLIICSDEIHCDLILKPHARHTPFAMQSPEAARRSITLMAPSKTFNIPGLGCSFAIIPDAALRRKFCAAMNGIVPHVNTLGLVACEAAFRSAGAWREELISYLRQNAAQVERFVATEEKLSMSAVEATYLAWIDARKLGVRNPQKYFEQAGVGLSDGADFGAPGFVRLNFGCRRALLDDALARISKACAAAKPD